MMERNVTIKAKPITAERFESCVGTPPINDDLERCNCAYAGEVGHSQCGWDDSRNIPNFVPGKARVRV